MTALHLLRATLAGTALTFAFTTAVQAQDDTAHCTLPGIQVVEDPAGDGTIPLDQLDVTAVYWAEPYDSAVPDADRVYITMKIATFAPTPAGLPNTTFYSNFLLADNLTYFVSYEPFPDPTAGSAFTYGVQDPDPTTGITNLTTLGDADPESNAAADGTITWVLSKDKIPAFAVSQFATNLNGEGRLLVGTSVTGGLVFVADDTATGAYEIKGNASCNPDAQKSGLAGVVGGALAPLLLLGLALGAALRRRRY